MKTPLQIAIEVIQGMDTSLMSSEMTKQVIVDFLSGSPIENEKIQLIEAFKDGQSRPLQMSSEWFKKKYNQIERDADVHP